MKEAYLKLMMQQDLSDDFDAAFYEKLNTSVAQKSHRINWKVAVVAVCILLMIPVTVLAAESIFGFTKVTVCERPISDNRPGIGLDIYYEDIKNHSPKDFAKHIQKLQEGEERLHATLEEVEEYLGLDLVDNPVLTAEDTHPVGAFKEPSKNFQTYCHIAEEHLLFADVQSVYNRNNVRFRVTATATIEHPTIEEDIYHSTNITYFDHWARDIETDQYMTQAGIPVLIVMVREGATYNYGADYGALLDCFACFAVNNISYKIEINGWSFSSDDRELFATPEEKVMATLMEVLDGFVIE